MTDELLAFGAYLTMFNRSGQPFCSNASGPGRDVLAGELVVNMVCGQRIGDQRASFVWCGTEHCDHS
jgi:hypothetical protein